MLSGYVTPRRTAARRSLRPRATILLAITLALVAYGGGLFGEAIWDDHLLLEGNPVITGRASWTAAFAQPFHPFDVYYRPLTVIVLGALGSPSGPTWPLHLASLLLHLAVCAGVYALARTLRAGPAAAAAAALVLLLHPAMVEAVAWISGVGDLLAAALMVASFVLWLRAAGPPAIPARPATNRAPRIGDGRIGRRPRLLAATACGLAALLAKETALALPVLMILGGIILRGGDPAKGGPAKGGPARGDGARGDAGEGSTPAGADHAEGDGTAGRGAERRAGQNGRSGPRGLAWLVPIALPAIYFALRSAACAGSLGGFAQGGALWRDGAPLAPSEQWMLRAVLLTRYLERILAPIRSQAPAVIDLPGSWIHPACWVGPAALLGLTAWTLRVARSRPGALVALAWFALTLLPAVLVAATGGDLLAERYLYIPACGLAPLLALLVPRGGRPARRRVRLAGVVLLVVLAVVTASRVRGWTREEGFLRRTLRLEPRAATAAANLGLILRNQGRWDEAQQLYGRTLAAMEAGRRAVVTERAAASACRIAYELGVMRARQGDPAGAERALRQALRFGPADERALAALGAALGEQRRYGEAGEVLRQGIARHPDSVILRENLARSAELLGDSAEAARQRTIIERLRAPSPDHAR